jgi:ADP-ribosylglycohydrolase
LVSAAGEAVEVELVPWDETGRAMLWSWPGQEGACAACATAALHEGLPVEGRAITACQVCARCGTEIVAVDAGHDDDDDEDRLDLTEGDCLDAGEWDASEMELDICQMYESDASFPEPPVVEVGGADEPMARRIERAEQDAHRAGLKRAILDRGTGALLGHAIGDALGLAAELLSVERARTWYPAGIRGYEDIVRDAHRGRWQPGEGPDDTGQMLALAAACAEPGVWHADGDAFERAFSARLKAWMESDTDPLGVAASVDRASRGRGAANGSLMRLTPLGVAWHHDPERASLWGARSSKVTHPDPRCVDACRVAAWAVAHLVGGASVDLVLSDIDRIAQIEETRAWLARARSTEPDALRLDEGTRYGEENRIAHVYLALAAAVSALAHAPDFETGLRSVLEAGGDADTTGAVVGGMLGARFGAQALPRRWVRPLRAAEACRNAAAELLPTP